MKRVQATKAFEIPGKRSQMHSLNIRSKVRSRLGGSINLRGNHVTDRRKATFTLFGKVARLHSLPSPPAQ